ncbi:MAG: ABC transporter ATP-binding protein/permease [candidate division KSB1 bacterium]|nr:ABC transporter ATP-binding protein/permease [candidate division KSB1 bacterium]MDZ7365883.1 ABC transporter ATP-binding protein/permease [candidate division KSB1 bacterium]MDZ7403882.1 ABC transporter ATP-binding protein/permease [candidate division KSB1 bacterium]
MAQFRIKYAAGLPRPHETWPLVKRFWPFMRPYKRTIAAIAVLMAVGLPISVVAPFLVKHLIDDVIPAGDTQRLLMIGSALIGLTLLSQALSYWQALLNNRFHLMVLYDLRRRLFAHVLHLPMSFYTQHDTGYIMSRQRDDLKHLSGIMADTFLRAAVNLIRALVFIGLLFYLDVALASTGLMLTVVFFGANLLFSRPLRRRNEAVQEAEAKTSTALHEGIIGINLIKATAHEKVELRRYVRALSAHVRATFHRDLLEIFSNELIGLAATAGAYFIVLVGAYRIMAGDSTFGSLFAFFMYLSNLFGATGALMRLNSNLQRSMNALQRIYEVLDTAPEILTAPRNRRKPGQCEIIFDRVGFNYLPDVPVLQNVSARIPAGAQVALVGPSGAGKTTFAHLIPRFYEPTAGRILLNGKDLRDLHLHDLRRLIGVVPQDVFLFDRTIRENIAYGNHVADPAAIEQAAAAANAHDFIIEFPNGYESKIGERGVRLSGGQKQRLAIAREILRNPPILILDEATSSLDSAAEALIQEALQRFKKNRTSIIIAHRLSTVIEADWILVFDKGRIIEQGRHEQLLAQGGFYAFLFETQFKRGLMLMD